MRRGSSSNLFAWATEEAERSRLRRAADVTVLESADLRQRNDGAVFGWLHGARLGRVLLECQVRTRAVIVAEVAAQTTTQMSLVQEAARGSSWSFAVCRAESDGLAVVRAARVVVDDPLAWRVATELEAAAVQVVHVVAENALLGRCGGSVREDMRARLVAREPVRHDAVHVGVAVRVADRLIDEQQVLPDVFAWLMRCRRLVTRYETKAENFLGLLRLACARLLWKRL